MCTCIYSTYLFTSPSESFNYGPGETDGEWWFGPGVGPGDGIARSRRPHRELVRRVRGEYMLVVVLRMSVVDDE